MDGLDPLDQLDDPIQLDSPIAAGQVLTAGDPGRLPWAEAAYGALPAQLQEGLRRRLCARGGEAPPVLGYCSDCSGIDAPKHACEEIIEAARLKAAQAENDGGAVGAQLKYLFASEGPGRVAVYPKIILTLNGAPQVLISDMLKRTLGRDGSISAFDEYTQRVVSLSPLSGQAADRVYTVGFECQDRSNANTANPKELDDRVTEESGMSTKTLFSSFAFIQADEPGAIVIEHTYRKDTAAKLVQHLRKLKIYAFRLWITSTNCWGRPMQRRRIFGLAINLMTHHLREPMGAWTRLLQRMATALGASAAVSLQDCLLPETHQALVQERRRHMARKPATDAEFTGSGWAKSYQQHQDVRQRLRGAGPAPPSVAEWMAQCPTDSWMAHLPAREADILCLHAHALSLVHGDRLKWEDAGFCWDINWSIGFGLKKHPQEQHKMTCPLRGSRFWYQAAKRYLLGLEGLYAHGFRRSVRWSLGCPGVTPRERDLAIQIATRCSQKAAGPHGAKRGASAGEAPGSDPQSAHAARTCGTVPGPLGRARADPAAAQTRRARKQCPQLFSLKGRLSLRLRMRKKQAAAAAPPPHSGLTLGALPTCVTPGCGRHCYGPSPHCCISCHDAPDGAPKHCPGCKKNKRSLCCTVAAHYGYVSHSAGCKRARGRRGLGGMCAQVRGLPGGGIPNVALQSLSGNTMSPPVVGSILMLALAAATPRKRRLERQDAEAAAAEINADAPAGGCEWVGSRVSAFPGTPLDQLQEGLSAAWAAKAAAAKAARASRGEGEGPRQGRAAAAVAKASAPHADFRPPLSFGYRPPRGW